MKIVLSCIFWNVINFKIWSFHCQHFQMFPSNLQFRQTHFGPFVYAVKEHRTITFFLKPLSNAPLRQIISAGKQSIDR